MSRAREHLIRIYEAAIRAVDPASLVKTHLSRDGPWACLSGKHEGLLPRWQGRTLIVGAGKASARMAAGCEAALGCESVRGLVVTSDGCSVPLRSIGCVEAGHPTPDQRGLETTERICRLLAEPTPEPALVLISGGASSLLVCPRPPIQLSDKIALNELLLRSGADIGEVNTVRKHVSLIKGGGLLHWRRQRPVMALILSDVIGDDPSVIGSGPTATDPATFAEAEAVVEDAARRVGCEAPAVVREVLRQGRRGELPETVKPGATVLNGVHNLVIGNNRTALNAAAAEARRLGYAIAVAASPLAGESVDAARTWLGWVRAEVQRLGEPSCLLAGGETTVTVRGTGKGGRNQEFALAMAADLAAGQVTLLSAGTDGIDGPTDAAGAFVDGTTMGRGRAAGLDPVAMLANNDAYSFFEALGDLYRPGATGTNVMDLKIAIQSPS